MSTSEKAARELLEELRDIEGWIPYLTEEVLEELWAGASELALAVKKERARREQ